MKRPTTVCAAWLSLPLFVYSHGLHFSLEVFADGEEIRVCYALDENQTDPANPLLNESGGAWRNPYHPGAWRSFLYLHEGSKTDAQLIAALLDARAWLLAEGIVSADEYPPFE